jgi:antitoxin HicB
MKTATQTYTLTIEKYPDGYLASFPGLRGCHTWGKTYEEAVRNAEEALVGYIEAAKPADGRATVASSPAKVSLGVVIEVPANV